GVELVKGPFAINLDHPVLLPAPLPRHGHRLLGRLARALPLRVGVKGRFALRRQCPLRYCLGPPSAHGRNPQRTHSTPGLGNLAFLAGRGTITPGSQPVPDAGEIPPQLRLEGCQALPRYPRCAPVRLYPPPCLDDRLLRYGKWLGPCLSLFPPQTLAVPLPPPNLPPPPPTPSPPSPPPPFPLLPRASERLPPWLPLRYAPSWGRPLASSPLPRKLSFSPSLAKPGSRSSRLSTGGRRRSTQVPRRLVPEISSAPGVDH